MGESEKIAEEVMARLDDTDELSRREYQDLLEKVVSDVECRLDAMKEEGTYED